MQARWGDVEFTVLQYKEMKDVFILGGIEDIQVGPLHSRLSRAQQELRLDNDTRR